MISSRSSLLSLFSPKTTTTAVHSVPCFSACFEVSGLELKEKGKALNYLEWKSSDVFSEVPRSQKLKKERGKMKGRIPIRAISMAYTRPGPSSLNTKTRDFFKIMIGDFQKRLRIPDAFIKLISKELCGRAVLEGPSGNCWLVKLSSSQSGTYFKDGWETFQRDHSLTFAEFLVFKYTGDMNFKVLIFGINGCERRDTFVVEPSQGLAFGQGKNCQSPRGDKGKLMSSPRPEVIFGTDERRDAFVVEPSQGLTFGPRKKCQSFRGDKGKSMPLPRSERLMLPEEETPPFPFFMRKIAVSYVRRPFIMYVPVQFAREHLPSSTMVRLLDKKGNKWKIKLQVGPIQTVFRRGWKKFVEDNRLKVGDSCRFQLVRKAVMKVKIYRC